MILARLPGVRNAADAGAGTAVNPQMLRPNGNKSAGLIGAIGTRASAPNIINRALGGGVLVLPGINALQPVSAALVAYMPSVLQRFWMFRSRRTQ